MNLKVLGSAAIATTAITLGAVLAAATHSKVEVATYSPKSIDTFASVFVESIPVVDPLSPQTVSVSQGNPQPDQGTAAEEIVNPSQTNSSQNPSQISSQILPTSGGIEIGQMEYWLSETVPNGALENAVRRELGETPADGETALGIRYFYNWIDLNNDGSEEAFVLLASPNTCGSGGCTAMILGENGSEYQLISRMTLVNAPIIVSTDTTNGWHDLILYVSGGGATASYHRLQFDGSGYPGNPSVEPTLPVNTVLEGYALITNDITPNTPAPQL